MGLEKSLRRNFDDLGIEKRHRNRICGFLEMVREHDRPTYAHSVRVGLKAREIAEFMNIDPRPAFYGILHDIGKTIIPKEIVGKTEGFDDGDMSVMKGHAMEGYRILMDKGYMFSAWLALTHHRYQQNRYPEMLPGLPFALNDGTWSLLSQYSRIVALADFNDALRRRNDKFGKEGMTPGRARRIMLAHNRDQEYLVRKLYKCGVFN